MCVTTEGFCIALLAAGLVVLAHAVALAVRAVEAFRRPPPLPPTARDAEPPSARGGAWLGLRQRPGEKNLSQARGS
jgi:hypothetical protein